MRKVFIVLQFVFCLCFVGCTKINDVKNPFSEELVKVAYVNSIKEYVPNAVVDEVTINSVYKIIQQNYKAEDDIRIINITSTYDILPYKIYREYIEKLEFRYISFHYYGFYQDKIYTLGELYNEGLIDMDLVCELFSLYCNSTTVLTYNEYQNIVSTVTEAFYTIDRYFGLFEGYSVVTLAYTSELCVTEPVRVHDVYFEFPYPDTCIRFIKDNIEIKLTSLLINTYVSKETIYELFSIYTKSKPVNEELINMLFTPIVPIYQKYVPDFDIDDLYLEYYNGEVNGAHVFTFGSNVWLAGKVDKDDDSIASSLLYGTGYDFIYYENNVYRKTDAINMGIITEDQINELKYGN